VAETDFPWINSTNVLGFAASTNGQVQYVAALAEVVKSIPAGMGLGVLWWGSEYQYVAGMNLAGYNTRSFFDANGDRLPVVAAFGQLVAPLKMSAIRANASIILEWPLSGAGCSLLTAPSLPPPGAWTPVTNAIESTGAVFIVTLPTAPQPSGFYLLRSD
jgi:hypothetical protein